MLRFASVGIRKEPASLDLDTFRMLPTEVTPFDNGNILLIDDILGVGSVIYDVIAKLKSSDKPPKNIRAFTIYSLGDVKKLIEGLADVEIDYLVSFPDVDYREEDKVTRRCSICKDHPEIIRVEE